MKESLMLISLLLACAAGYAETLQVGACGEARITQGNVDIGAYEFGGAGSPLVCR